VRRLGAPASEEHSDPPAEIVEARVWPDGFPAPSMGRTGKTQPQGAVRRFGRAGNPPVAGHYFRPGLRREALAARPGSTTAYCSTSSRPLAGWRPLALPTCYFAATNPCLQLSFGPPTGNTLRRRSATPASTNPGSSPPQPPPNLTARCWGGIFAPSNPTKTTSPVRRPPAGEAGKAGLGRDHSRPRPWPPCRPI